MVFEGNAGFEVSFRCWTLRDMRYLRGLDIETGRMVWEIPQVGPTDGKRVAGTAGGTLFYGDASGNFVAVDERRGIIMASTAKRDYENLANDVRRG